MSLLLVAAIVIGVSAAAVALMYVVRSRAKVDYFYIEVERGAGIFAFLGTAFAVLMAFVFFEAFESFNDARTGAEEEATTVLQLTRTAKFFPQQNSDPMVGEMICYGRAVIDDGWPAMKHGERSELVQGWVDRFGASLRQLQATTTTRQQAAFLQLLQEEDKRAEGRRKRLSEATRSLPAPVWFLLGLGASLTVGIALFFADRREAFIVQGSLMAAIAALVVSGLLLVWFLDHPYEDQAGSIRPDEMTRLLELIEAENPTVVAPCDSRGEPVAPTALSPS